VTHIFKILPAADWRRAQAAGLFEGSAVDLSDGFIHFSAADQVIETSRRYFRGQSDLVVLVVEAESLGGDLRWEPSRGGQLFPHLYAPLGCEKVVAVRPAPLMADGAPDLGGLAP